MLSSEKSQPTCLTFIHLLRCFPEGGDAPKEILALMDRANARPDDEWIRMAIDHEARVGRKDLTRAWRLMEVAKMRGIPLSPKTFTKLAKFIQTSANFKMFLEKMDEFDVEPSAKSFEIMVKYRRNTPNDWRLRTKMFQVWTKRFGMRPSDEFRREVEERLGRKRRGYNKSDEIDVFLPVYEAWLSKNNLKWG